MQKICDINQVERRKELKGQKLFNVYCFSTVRRVDQKNKNTNRDRGNIIRFFYFFLLPIYLFIYLFIIIRFQFTRYRNNNSRAKKPQMRITGKTASAAADIIMFLFSSFSVRRTDVLFKILNTSKKYEHFQLCFMSLNRLIRIRIL